MPKSDPSTPSNTGEIKRQHTRVAEFETRATLTFDTGQTLAGTIKNLSHGGVMFSPQDEQHTTAIGNHGTLIVPATWGRHTLDKTFACTVTRITHEGWGLQFDESETFDFLSMT